MPAWQSSTPMTFHVFTHWRNRWEGAFSCHSCPHFSSNATAPLIRINRTRQITTLPYISYVHRKEYLLDQTRHQRTSPDSIESNPTIQAIPNQMQILNPTRHTRTTVKRLNHGHGRNDDSHRNSILVPNNRSTVQLRSITVDIRRQYTVMGVHDFFVMAASMKRWLR